MIGGKACNGDTNLSFKLRWPRGVFTSLENCCCPLSTCPWVQASVLNHLLHHSEIVFLLPCSLFWKTLKQMNSHGSVWLYRHSQLAFHSTALQETWHWKVSSINPTQFQDTLISENWQNLEYFGTMYIYIKVNKLKFIGH